MQVLNIKHLTKYYGKKNVVDDVTFSLLSGEIFGFVGPNGAGKSTTLKMITGLTSITKGRVTVCGCDITLEFKNALKNIGAVIENPQFYPYMSGLNNLKLFASFYGKDAEKRINTVTKLVGMQNRIKDKVSKYSLGMKQRLGIAMALINNPKLLILDEPTNGLDPDGIVEIREILKNLAQQEKIAIIISSHNLSELERVCDRIGIINNGRLIDILSMSDIENQLSSGNKVQLMCDYPNYASMSIKEKYNIDCIISDKSITLRLPEKHIATVISYLNYKKIKVFGIKKIEKTLEELYFDILSKDRDSSSVN